MKLIDEYRALKESGHFSAFAGMNTKDGFRGGYRDIIDESTLRRLYIIKGSAGSGKSTLMKRIGAYVTSSGHKVKYYLCGSDADSVDCIVIDDALAVLDGTSPHAHEMKYPGGVSRLIDVTTFFDAAQLERARDEIIRLTDEKRECFDSAYTCIAALSRVREDMQKRAERMLLHEKFDAFVERTLGKMMLADRGCDDCELILNSVGMKGKCRLDTLERCAERTLYIKDEYFTAFAAMNAIYEKLTRDSRAVTVVRDPYLPSCYRGIFVNEARVYFTVEASEYDENHASSDEKVTEVNMARFTDKERVKAERQTLRAGQKCAEMLEHEALRHLATAGERHFALEKIYSSAMDFAGLEKLTRRLCCEISDIL